MQEKMIAALLTGLFAAGVAQAATPPYGTNLSTRVDNLSMTVYDLAPADQFAAAYTIGAIDTALTVGYKDDGWQQVSETLDGPGALTITNGASHGTASWQGAPGWLETAAHVESSFSGTFNASAVQSIVIAIAPRTAFVVTGLAVHEADAYGEGAYSYWQSNFHIDIDPGDGASENGRTFYKNWGSVDLTQTDDFALSYANTTDQVRNVTLTYRLGTEGMVMPLQVPEPATWLMLGAGVLAVAGRARLGRKRTTPA